MPVANAGVTFYDVYKNNVYKQTGTAQPASPSSFFASGTVWFSNTTDLTTATVTFAGTPSPINLTSGGTGLLYTNLSYASQAAMDAAFPSTTYQFDISGGNLGAQNASLTTPASDLFTSQVPFLSGTSFTDLQGMDPTTSHTLTWGGYTASVGINDPDIFLTISRFSNGQEIFNSGALSNLQTSLVLPAGTLSPSIKYQFELDYTSRINTANAGFGTAHSLVGFDLRTDGTFTTTVPEPISATEITAGAALVILLKRLHIRKADGSRLPDNVGI